MSWKGFTKAVTRLPHMVMAKAGYAEETMDDEFQKAEIEFKDLEASTRQLEQDVKQYKIAVKGVVSHAVGIGIALQTLFDMDPTGPRSALEACIADYNQATAEWSNQASPAFEDQIQRVIIANTDNFMQIMKAVRGTIDKRNRKHIDYDRRLTALKKAQEANEKSGGAKVGDLSKAESAFDEARREYETINAKIKEEIPFLAALRIQFMDPFIQTLIFFQINLFTFGLQALERVVQHIDQSNPDIDAVFKYQIEPAIEQIKVLAIINPRLLDPNAEARDPIRVAQEAAAEKRKSRFGGSPIDGAPGSPSEPPSYDQGEETSGPAAGFSWDSKASEPAASLSGLPRAVALFPYQSETDGDLNFAKDDIIEIVQMTESTDDWWTGRLRGRDGFFPANYVKLL